jgi:hypothetical protein
MPTNDDDFNITALTQADNRGGAGSRARGAGHEHPSVHAARGGTNVEHQVDGAARVAGGAVCGAAGSDDGARG